MVQTHASHLPIFFLALCTIIMVHAVGCMDTIVKDSGAKVYQIDDVACTRCAECINPCPQNAISEHILEDRGLIIIIDQEKCIGCGECVPYCEFDALKKTQRPEYPGK